MKRKNSAANPNGDCWPTNRRWRGFGPVRTPSPSARRERPRTPAANLNAWGLAMSKRRNRNKRIDASHVRLYRWLLDSPAYLSLSCAARAVLIETARAYDGTNNGRIGLSIRRASERCNIARDTASRAFSDLEERGFVDCVTRGAFSRKSMHASEWRLTWWPCDVTGELSSKRFMNWGKQNAVLEYTGTGLIRDHPSP